MNKTILRTNAIQVYSFLSFLNAKQKNGDLKKKLKILDCGAGGAMPPLAIFVEQGFDAWGIDISEDQLDMAKQFCVENDVKINFQKADMQRIPFTNESFDCVYEHYSMCHLSKEATKQAINEMQRVTRKNGFAMLGVISMDTWPKSIFGKEKQKGEFWVEEADESSYMHCMFSDEEADKLVQGWKIVSKEKHTNYLRKSTEKTTMDKWLQLYEESGKNHTFEMWQKLYDQRSNFFQYNHIFYMLKNSRA
jgi:ubiquinone/menaquinone biosynthesis C-methylase UbiE